VNNNLLVTCIPEIEEFRSYLEKCFDFEQVTVKKFRTWAERRQFNRDMKRKQAVVMRAPRLDGDNIPSIATTTTHTHSFIVFRSHETNV